MQKKTQSSKIAKGKKKRHKSDSGHAFPIVGFGASAGGLEAFSNLLAYLKPDLGMAYVLIMHLSPTHKSSLTEILQSKTKMPVHTVKDGIKVERNTLYVIPPNTFMSIVDGHLALAPRSVTSLGNFAIDYFMSSLAEIYQNKAVGVILSGTASDGTLGLKAVKSHGGITFAQDVSARFDSMPRHAIDGGYVDYVLSPEKIARELQRLVKTEYATLPAERIEQMPSESKDDQEILKKILTLVKNKWGTDFDLHYKKSSTYRRIARRMTLNKCDSLRAYLNFVIRNEKEVDLLYDDFLINVTTFFRDLGFFGVLSKQVLPVLTKGRTSTHPLRVWVAGCSTGEEVFSIAICILEYLEKKKMSIPIQIFGSDLDGQALAKARAGIYPLSSVIGVSPKRLGKYFTKIDGHYQIIRSVREMCVFSQHNLLSDPPFSRMDFISCQNVLIYMETLPQKRILQAFHFALKPDGNLFLGKSETVNVASDLFESADKRVKVFTRTPTRTPQIEFAIHPIRITSGGPMPVVERPGVQDFSKEIEKIMLSRFVYPGVVVDKNLMIVQFFGATSAYLAPVTGKATLNVLKMIREELLVELRALLQQVQKYAKPVTGNDVIIHNKKVESSISIEVLPYHTTLNEAFYLVIFREKDVNDPKSVKLKKGETAGNSAVVRLEQELIQSREIIRTTSEEYEATSEELQTNNEIILSSNEELQSVNEELETSKEELQSANEELTTINEELYKRNFDLKESQNFSEAIIQTVHSPLLVLTVNLQVRMANHAFYETFKLTRENTEGNFLYSLGNGSWDIPVLREHLKNIFPIKTKFKDFELKHTFPGVGEKTLVVTAYKLLKTDDSKETLVLLAFDDVTRILHAESSLLKTQEQLKLSLVGDSIGTWWWDVRSNTMKWSRENEILNGVKEGTFSGTYLDWENVIDAGDLLYVQKALTRHIAERTPVEIEYRILKPDRKVYWILSKGHVYYGQDDRPERMIGVSMDITDRKMQSEALESRVEKRTRELQDALDDVKSINQQLEEFAFISSHDLQEPLRKITTFASMLDRPDAELNEFSKKYIERISASAMKMSTLMTALHSYAHLLSDHSEEAVSVDIKSIMHKVEAHYAAIIKEKQAIIKHSDLVNIKGVTEEIYLLFLHLIGNSLKFSKERPVIHVSTSRLDAREMKTYPRLDQTRKYVAIDITDNGIGFEQKYANRIFQLFQRLEERKVDGGTGLGLAICKKVVEQHGGLISATGILNAGATFTVILPVG